MTVIDIFIKHESEIRKPTKIITQFDRCNKCNINGTDTVENELEFMHVISSESHQRWLSSIVMRFQKSATTWTEQVVMNYGQTPVHHTYIILVDAKNSIRILVLKLPLLSNRNCARIYITLRFINIHFNDAPIFQQLICDLIWSLHLRIFSWRWVLP